MRPPAPVTRSTKAAPNKHNKSKPSIPTSTKTALLEPSANPSGTEVRLHITPLTPALLPTLLPPSLFSSDSTNYPPPVSYHTLETLPDKSYGYVDLPPQLAQKLTTRLNGTIFRGVKVSVQKAKPRTWTPPALADIITATDPATDHQEGRLPEKKKRRKEDSVHPGLELPDGRWIKRAWTKVPITGTMGKSNDRKDKRGKKKEEVKKGSLLFQTTLPPTIPLPAVTDPKALKKLEKKRKRAIAAAEAAAVAAEVSSSDNAGSGSEAEKSKKKKAKKNREVKLPQDKTTIKEFASNTKFPGFLKTSQLDPNNKRGKVTQFVDGVGWVSEEGQVIDDSAVKKAVEMRRLVLGTTSEEAEIWVYKESGEKVAKDIDNESRNHDGQEVEDTHSDSDSSELDQAETAEKARLKEVELGKLGKLVDDDESRSSHPDEPGSESEPDSSSGESDVDESKTNKDEENVEEKLSKKPPSSIAEEKHGFVEESNASSRSNSTESEEEDSSQDSDTGSDSDDDSSESEQEDESESEQEEEAGEKEEHQVKVVPTKAPSLKLSIPIEATSEAHKPHPLEALFKPSTNVSTTTDAGISGGGLFNFGLADDNEEENHTQPLQTPQKRPYRSAAPTPDTAVFSKTIKWPDPATISSFEPTTPIAPRKLSFHQPPAIVSSDVDAPLLFQGNVDSAYLRGLSIWSGKHLPEAKSITELPPDDEQDVADPDAPKKKKRGGNANEVSIGKHKERKIGQGSAVASRAETRKEIWKERFFKYRGEWNREWKNKKREAGKLARRKKRERGVGAGAGAGSASK